MNSRGGAGWNTICLDCLRVSSAGAGCPRTHLQVDYHAARGQVPKKTAKPKEWEIFLRKILNDDNLTIALTNLKSRPKT